VQAGHFRRYRRQQLEMLLRKSGFRVLGASYFFSFLPPALFFCRCVPSLFGRRPLNRANYKKLHQRRPRGLLAQIERAEVRRIAGGAAIRFGSSCLLAAEKD
jgi:hypothetical protein